MWPGGLTCVAIITYLSADPFTTPPRLLMEVVAAGLVILAQIQADRWVRGAKRHRLLLAAAFVILATIVHASLADRAEREAIYFASGMTAIIGLGSLVSVIPEYLRSLIPHWAHGALIRGVVIGGAGSLFYFEKYI